MGGVTNTQLLQKVDIIIGDVAHIKETTDDMHECIYGNGTPDKGLNTRVKVLEVMAERVEKLIWLFAAAIVSSAVVAAFAIIKASN